MTGEGGKGGVGAWSKCDGEYIVPVLYVWGGDQSDGLLLIVYMYLLDGEGVGVKWGGCDRRGC